MSAHTPGPWLVSGGTVYSLHSEPQRNRFFAQVQRGRRDDASYDELVANARLMAAAPDLLEALREAEAGLEFAGADKLEVVGEFVPAPLAALRIVRAAIAKATGATHG